MDGEICIVPSFGREALLKETLAAIRKADPSIELHVFSDRGHYSDELGQIAWNYDTHLHFIPKHRYPGNTLIVKEMMKWLLSRTFTLAFFVESDCIVAPGFFTFGRTHKDDSFSGCGWLNPAGIKAEVYLQTFNGVAGSLPRDSVKQILREIKVFSSMPYDNQITAYLLRTKQHCIYPFPRLADHVGYQGIHFNNPKPEKLCDTGLVKG